MINLSIIIPHYNDSNRLERCLASIPKMENMEIIVVDDNSSETEQQKAKKIVSDRAGEATFLVNPEETHSAGVCRNIGLEHAKGKWVFFSDADDFLTDSFCESIKKYMDSDYDAVFFGTTSVDELTGELSDRHDLLSRLVNDFSKNEDKTSELYLRYHHYGPVAKMIRRELIVKNDIRFEGIRYSNDLMFSTKVGYYAKKIKADKGVIYCITSTEGSLTKIKNIESFDTRKRAMIRRYAFLYHHLTKDEMRMIDMKYTGIRYVLSPIKSGYGIKLAFEYLKLIKSLKAPLVI